MNSINDFSYIGVQTYLESDTLMNYEDVWNYKNLQYIQTKISLIDSSRRRNDGLVLPFSGDYSGGRAHALKHVQRMGYGV